MKTAGVAVAATLGVLLLLVLAVVAVRSAVRSSLASAEVKTAASPKPEPVDVEKCRQALDTPPTGWSDIKKAGGNVYIAATPDFLVSNYDNRAALTQLVWCVYTDGRMDHSIDRISYLDPKTRKEFGRWIWPQALTFDY